MLSFDFNFTDALEETNSRQDDPSLQSNEEKKQSSCRRRKALEVKRILPKQPLKLSKLVERKPNDSNRKKGSSSKKNSSAVSKVPQFGKRKLGVLNSEEDSSSKTNSSAVSKVATPVKKKRCNFVSDLNYCFKSMFIVERLSFR